MGRSDVIPFLDEATLTGFTAANHRQAHQLVEAGRMIGKLTVAYA